jgi:hypothetical protein
MAKLAIFICWSKQWWLTFQGRNHLHWSFTTVTPSLRAFASNALFHSARFICGLMRTFGFLRQAVCRGLVQSAAGRPATGLVRTLRTHFIGWTLAQSGQRNWLAARETWLLPKILVYRYLKTRGCLFASFQTRSRYHSRKCQPAIIWKITDLNLCWWTGWDVACP